MTKNPVATDEENACKLDEAANLVLTTLVQKL